MWDWWNNVTAQGRQWKPIRFEEGWTKFEGCKELIRNNWHTMEDSNAVSFNMKLVKCLRDLKKWNAERLGGSIKWAIARKEQEIQNVMINRGGNWRNVMLCAEKDLEDLLEEDEMYRRQRSREDWIN